jgi:aminomethyltransferase
MAELRKTPLNDVHRESGARMVPFGGWDMPVEYSGLIAEHNAVRAAAGLFDVSHMGQFEVEGEGALAFLQRVTANNVAKLADGQAQYSALPMPSGCPVDDIIVYRRSARRFLVVVNAANIEKDWHWLLAQQPAGCGLHDLSDQFALLALQGPKAAAILQGLTPIDLGTVSFYHFAEGRVGGAEAILARTGYTGEDGFEIVVAPEAAPALWRAIVEAGPTASSRPGSGRETRCASRPG